MKKLVITFVMAALVVGLFTVVAGAVPTEPKEAQVFAEIGDASDARVWRLTGGWNEMCNTTPRSKEVTVRAYVAQWARWAMDYAGWEWYVKKPGTYYADCITGEIQSNGNVTLLVVGMDDLKFVEGPLEGSINDTIKTWYGVTSGGLCDTPTCPPTNSPEEWFSPAELSEQSITLFDSAELHSGLRYKLWNKIEVVNCNTVGMYENQFDITLTLDNQVDWIDGDTGDFDDKALPGYPGVLS